MLSYAAAQPAYSYQQPKQLVKQSYRPTTTSVSNSGVYSIQQGPAINSFNVQSPLPAPATQFISQPIENPQNQYIPPAPISNPAQVEQFNPAPQYLAPVQQQQQAVYAPANNYPQYQQSQQQTIISKDIYIHSAPEETEEIGNERGADAGPIRKNYRIVFIKAPTQNIKLNLESLKQSQAANEEKTVIYVLSKKPDLANLQSQLVNVQTEQKVQKPEVYFIKYKTQEEANRAQQEIQAQYDALGGATHISDEGIAPVTSVINGGSVNVGSVVSGFATSASENAPSFVASNPNFVQSASSNQQQFIQQSFAGNQAAASSNVRFGIEVPKQKYLPIHKK